MKILHRLSYIVVVPLAVMAMVLFVILYKLYSVIKWVVTGIPISSTYNAYFIYTEKFISILDKYYPL